VAKISTHVLDTSIGQPAANVKVQLFHLGESRRPHCSMQTNKDGRTDAPLLTADRIPSGIYELVFTVGEYFSQRGVPLSDPPFLDEVVIRFGVSDETGNYHIPLLLSPFGYSTYRGS
jgi:5-hydroxyisourate hydrolase